MATFMAQQNPFFGGPPINRGQVRKPIKTIYAQMNTKNKSFLDMHHYLKNIGIKNNAFMLALIDPDLANIDPFDPNLNQIYKQKILVECMHNYWYFLREIVRLPSTGGSMRYELNRGNLAYNFCACLNYNIFFEEPRLTNNRNILERVC